MKIKIWTYGLLIILIFAVLIESPWRAKAQSEEARVFLPILQDRFDTGTGDVRGVVIDAVGGSPLSGAMVCFKGNCDQTDDKGTYKLTDILAGSQFFNASADTYYSIGRWADVIANQETQVNLVMSQILHLSQVKMRIVTTWSANPCWPIDANPPCVSPAYENDLDAFLWVTTPGFSPTLVENVSRAQCTSYPYACKENDAREGTGPETIAVQDFKPGSNYYFGVMNYNQYQPTVPPMRATQAFAGIYDEQGLISTFSVPPTGAGNFWYVFSMDASGAIHPQNCIIELSPSEAALPDCNLQPAQNVHKMPQKP